MMVTGWYPRLHIDTLDRRGGGSGQWVHLTDDPDKRVGDGVVGGVRINDPCLESFTGCPREGLTTRSTVSLRPDLSRISRSPKTGEV